MCAGITMADLFVVQILLLNFLCKSLSSDVRTNILKVSKDVVKHLAQIAAELPGVFHGVSFINL